MANIKSIGGNPIVLGLDGLTDEAKATLGSASVAAGALIGSDGTESTWAQRVTTGDGAATIERMLGNTVVWNQLALGWAGTVHGVTFTLTNGLQGATGTADASASSRLFARTVNVGHKYLAAVRALRLGSGNTAGVRVVKNYSQVAVLTESTPALIVDTSDWEPTDAISIQITASTGVVADLSFYPQLFDLTQMFGAGNEPSTVAEFESMFPKAYYPYDAGSMLSVNIDGVESTGFNQWDEQWEVGGIRQTDGTQIAQTDRIRSKNYIPVLGGQTYYFKGAYYVAACYDGNKSFIGNVPYRNGLASCQYYLDMPANACYMRFSMTTTYGTTYKNDICINISDPARNGTYEPYMHDEHTIPVSTYFPNNMRSAGTVRDELTAGAAVTRVAAVDLGTLTWTAATDSVGQYFYATLTGYNPPVGTSVAANATCAKYPTVPANNIGDDELALASNDTRLFIRDTTYADAAAFKSAMSGVYLYYALATPTTQAIDPPLNLTYKVERGGTESVMVPTGEQTAPPVMDVAYGGTKESIIADALSAIAAQDGPTATANHAVGTYLTMGGTLYKVTSAIAVGETITAGTNVTATTVMAEVIALTQ